MEREVNSLVGSAPEGAPHSTDNSADRTHDHVLTVGGGKRTAEFLAARADGESLQGADGESLQTVPAMGGTIMIEMPDTMSALPDPVLLPRSAKGRRLAMESFEQTPLQSPASLQLAQQAEEDNDLTTRIEDARTEMSSLAFQGTVEDAIREIEDAFGRVVYLNREREKESRERADNLGIINWNPPMDGNEGLGDFPWWKVPTKGQRVWLCCCERLRQIDENGKEDPFNHHACGCWWLSFVACGCDPDTIVDLQSHGTERFGAEYGYMSPMIEKFGWKLPPFGRKRNYNPWKDVPKARILERKEDFGSCPVNHINAMTLCSPSVLRYLYQRSFGGFYFLVLSLASVVIPALFCGLMYGLIPMANDPAKCSWSNNLTVMFVHNPIGEVAVTFCHIQLLITSVDNDLPWRPFRMYWELLVASYLVQIAFAGILLATSTYMFYLNCIVCRFLGLCTTLLWMKFRREKILGFRNYRVQDHGWFGEKHLSAEEVSENMSACYTAFSRYLVLEFVYIAVCSGYILLIQKYKAKQAFINFSFTVLSNFFRVGFQHITSVMHRDMNFILSFLTIFGYKSMVVVFVSPDFGDNVGAFITAGLEPLTTAAVALMHQTYTWIRFRAWVKKVYEPVLISCFCSEKRNNPLAWPLGDDYDVNGRGSSTSIAEYRRTKVQYDLIKMIALIVGYSMFLAVLPFLKYGMNHRNFPYSEDGSAYFETNGWSSNAFKNAAVFSAFVVVWVTGWLFFYHTALSLYGLCNTRLSTHQVMTQIVIDEFMGLFYREPPKLAALNLLVSSVAMMTTRMFTSYGNVFWMQHFDSFDSNSGCNPFGA